MSQSVRFYDKTNDEFVTVTKDNPLPVTGAGGGETQSVDVNNWPTTQKVSGSVGVNNHPKWQAVGAMVQGQVATGEEKMIDLSAAGVTFIEIQASPDNTVPLKVGDVSGFTAFWVKPGEMQKFYYGKIYVSHSADAAQEFAYQAVKYG
ncbi:hypothetical protein P5609_001115 [Bacillus licheniformis]|uniref:hypothetical protein n=1 Tax=Bacillus licheniformis TaxID=1402 RepID=UPI00115E30CF|nr:hypothetical protein [Bacillus licheniformis]MDH3162292.1 hypothetical protein [Bacillus licheniformis]QDL76957.1 hypothetical protein D9Y32_05565 [Bacillus licheniformis]TWK98005.1 hypothetical protein CHCC20327_2801 [Bacillus licheniformis]